MISDMLKDLNQSDERYNIDLDSSKSKRFIKDLIKSIHDIREELQEDKIKFKKINPRSSGDPVADLMSYIQIPLKIYHSAKISKIMNDYTGYNGLFIIIESNEPTAYYAPNLHNSTHHLTDFLSANAKSIGRGDVLLDHSRAINRIKELNEISHSDNLEYIDNSITEELVNHFICITDALFTDTDLTDEEIVAIILHEIGHAVSFITETAQEFHSSSMWGEIAIYSVNDNRSFEELKDLLDEMIKIKKEIKEEDEIEDRTSLNLMFSLKIIFKYIHKALNRLIINKIEEKVNDFFLRQLINGVIMSFVNSIILRSLRERYNHKKYGDKLGDSYDIAFHERWADEYVAEHGMGSHLAKALKKLTLSTLNKYPRLFFQFGIFLEMVQLTYMFVSINKDINTIINTNNTMKINGAYIPYDVIRNRLELTRKNTYKLFKKRNLSSKIKKHLSEQIKSIDEDIKNIDKLETEMRKKLRTNPLFRLWYKMVKRLVSGKIAITPGNIFSKDLEEFYFKMHNRNEYFIKNPFDHYQYLIDNK